MNDDHQRVRVYRMLDKAADRIGTNNYRAQLAAHVKHGRSPKTFRFSVTDAHKRVIEAMPAVLNGTLTPEEAAATLHEYEVERERFV